MSLKSCIVESLKNRRLNDLKLFCHGIYEFRKGVRNLILITERASNYEDIVNKLEQENISYVIGKVTNDKINVFYGADECINIVKTFVHKDLNKITPEQDFMLGIMLGYDNKQQCKRYLESLKNKQFSYQTVSL